MSSISRPIAWWCSRDAEDRPLPLYNQFGILADNPFDVLDVKGVGKLMKLAVDWGRSVKPGLHVGIRGEHGGHPESIAFCQEAGHDYASCSAPRVPLARLAAPPCGLEREGLGLPTECK